MRYIESFKIFAPEFRKWNTRMPYIIENTLNPIRHILEQIPIKPHPDLPMIPLSIGDPSVFGNFPAPKEASQDRISFFWRIKSSTETKKDLIIRKRLS